MTKMLNIVIIGLILVVISVPCYGIVEDSTSGPGIDFEELEYDFGDLNQGQKVLHTFLFTNGGNEPLIINNVLSTCGCTVPEWPKEPILPGQKGSIKVVFDSKGKLGRQNKIITIRSNAPGNQHRIRIYGMVLPPEK